MTTDASAVPTTKPARPADRSADSRLAFLDTLRGIAATMVVIHHVMNAILPDSPLLDMVWYAFGVCGVTVFFLCSGFIIPASLERSPSLGSFWLRRVLRLYPLYWVSVGVWAFYYQTGIDQPPPDFSAHPLAASLANASMLQMFFGYSYLSSVYWTLTFELMFYILVSFLFAAQMLRHTVALVAVIIGTTALTEIILPLSTGIVVPNGVIGSFVVLTTGILLHRVYQRSLHPTTALVLGSIGLATIVISGFVQVVISGNYFQLYLLPAWVLGYSIVLAVFLHRGARWHPLLTWLGRISYSLYLIHPIVIHIVPPTGNPILTIIVWTACIATLSVATYRWIEEPAMRLARKLVPRSRARVLPG